MQNVVANLKDSPHSITLVLEHDSVKSFEGFKKIVVPNFFSKSFMGMLWHFLVLPFYTLTKKYDCFLILAASRRYLAFCKIPQIGVVHDLSPYRIEGKYDPIRMFYLKKIQPWLGKRLDEIVAISQSTKNDIIKYWKIPSEKITVNYNGLRKLPPADDHIQKRLNLEKYILYVSRIEHPGKNHLGLIKAYEQLPLSIRSKYKLVLAGSEWKGAKPVMDYASKSQEVDRILFTGFVTHEELTSLYKHASLFVFPSFSEGFGLPLVEAMSQGLPCACANTTSLAEIGGDAVLLFDPKKPEEICNCIINIIKRKEYFCSLVKSKSNYLSEFDWKIHSQKLLSICKNIYNNNSVLKIFEISFLNGRIIDFFEIVDNAILNNKRKKIAFVNAHYLNVSYEDKEQKERLQTFDYILPDGSGISLACKILGYRYRENLNGTDLFPILCDHCEKNNYSLYFFGAAEDVAERAAKNMISKHPNLNIVGCRNGFFTSDYNANIVSEINSKKPDFLIVGLGARLQEKWIDENFIDLNCKVAIAMGGIFDFYSGDKSRAKPLVRKLGIEWLHRLYLEPSRLARRYLIGNPLFLLRVIKSKFSQRKQI
jgi:exopolysaccharide biosynthesis WecB/TagA/CpsF family protein